MSYAVEERRAYPRTRYSSHAVIHAKGRCLHCLTVDLSASGALIMPPARAAAGLALKIDFTLDTRSDPVSVEATVVRECSVAERYAWAVRFDGISADVQRQLAMFVNRRIRNKGNTQETTPTSDPLRPPSSGNYRVVYDHSRPPAPKQPAPVIPQKTPSAPAWSSVIKDVEPTPKISPTKTPPHGTGGVYSSHRRKPGVVEKVDSTDNNAWASESTPLVELYRKALDELDSEQKKKRRPQKT